jgi:hypothetical protein
LLRSDKGVDFPFSPSYTVSASARDRSLASTAFPPLSRQNGKKESEEKGVGVGGRDP